MTRDRHAETYGPTCPHCSRRQVSTSSGVRRNHRTADQPTAAKCPGSGQPMETR